MATANKILVNVQQLSGRPAPALDRLRAAGFTLVPNEASRLLTEDELIARLPGVYATVAGGEPYTERVFASAPELRIVARFGVGYDKVDIAAATRHGVVVAMAFGGNHETVADYAFAFVLALGCVLLPHHRQVAEGGWGLTIRPGVWGRTIGLVGLGRIGRAVAVRGRGFAMRVLAADPQVTPAQAHEAGVELVPLDTLLAEADFVSLHLPLSEGTRHIIGARELARMKPTAFIVNTARGGLIDEAALHAALTTGRLAGAGLDVFAREPPVGSPLLGLPNVVLAPHAAGMDLASERLTTEICVSNILELRAGRMPAGNVLNPQALRA